MNLSVSTNNTTSGRMLGCYILCSEILVEVDQLAVKVKGRSVRSGQVKVEVIDKKSKRSTNKKSTSSCVATD
jgi:hypothetical protein